MLKELVSSCIPLVSNGVRVPSWYSAPPKLLLRRRTVAWRRYKQIRCLLGRSSSAARVAWEKFSSLNMEYRSHSFSQACNYERGLVQNLSRRPKLFLGYIRWKKRRYPPVGPLKVGGELVSSPGGMSEVFNKYFSSVFDTTNPAHPAEHQSSASIM